MSGDNAFAIQLREDSINDILACYSPAIRRIVTSLTYATGPSAMAHA